MDKEKAEKILEDFYANSCDSSYRKADALENITELLTGEELYYGVLNGNLRDEKGHMK